MSIISAEHVLTNTHQLLLLDVREHSSYLDGHVAGAIHLDLKQWEKLAKTAEGELNRSEVWWPAIGKLGIVGHTNVVVYGDGRIAKTARAGSSCNGMGQPSARPWRSSQ
ncbi:hypothetical protein D9M73_100780 [compost metagenome]